MELRLSTVICAFRYFSGSTSNAGQMLSGVAPLWSALMVASSACQAGASIMKVTTVNNVNNALRIENVNGR